MKQMPVEGRKFTRVDATWRELMGTAVKDPHALVATEQPNMLPRSVRGAWRGEGGRGRKKGGGAR